MRNLLELAYRSYLYLPIYYIPVLIKLTAKTNMSGAMAETGDSGEMVGINCKMAVIRK